MSCAVAMLSGYSENVTGVIEDLISQNGWPQAEEWQQYGLIHAR